MANIKISNIVPKSNQQIFVDYSYELETEIQNKILGGGTIDINNGTCTDCNRRELRTFRKLMR